MTWIDVIILVESLMTFKRIFTQLLIINHRKISIMESKEIQINGLLLISTSGNNFFQ